MKSNDNLLKLIREDGRYPVEAFQFVQEGLRHTVEMAETHKSRQGAEREEEGGHSLGADFCERRHVSGGQLCQGIRHLAQERWGLMAIQVLNRWNITQTRDFGEMVFLMVENGYMLKQPHDRIEDFDGVYDFKEAFERDYEIQLESEEIADFESEEEW